jgi:DNA modification methylase
MQTKSCNSNLSEFLTTYKRKDEAIEIDFRKLVDWIPYGERATHLIHPYPAKLLVHIPHFFLNNDILSDPGDYIMDPFCGSGTVLLEGILNNRNAIGSDINPLAILIAKVKTKPLCIDKIKSEHIKIKQNLKQTKKRIAPGVVAPNVVNINYWFHPKVKKQLLILKESIQFIENSEIKIFFELCFSNIVKRVSNADPRLSVPVKLRIEKYHDNHWFRKKAEQILSNIDKINIYNLFDEIVGTNIKRMESFNGLYTNNSSAIVVKNDIRKDVSDIDIAGISDNIQLIITSPPYAGAQKYVRATSLNLGWLGHCQDTSLRDYEELTIGREHFKKTDQNLVVTGIDEADKIIEKIYEINRLRACIAGIYLTEMKRAFEKIYDILKIGGYFVLIAGNNYVCRQKFKTADYLHTIANSLGFKTELILIDNIRSRGLMTKRNKTASIISREWIFVFRKEKE